MHASSQPLNYLQSAVRFTNISLNQDETGSTWHVQGLLLFVDPFMQTHVKTIHYVTA